MMGAGKRYWNDTSLALSLISTDLGGRASWSAAGDSKTIGGLHSANFAEHYTGTLVDTGDAGIGPSTARIASPTAEQR